VKSINNLSSRNTPISEPLEVGTHQFQSLRHNGKKKRIKRNQYTDLKKKKKENEKRKERILKENVQKGDSLSGRA